MPPPNAPAGTLALGAALDRSEPLARLLERARESRARFAVVAALLPDGLRDAVRAGPLDEDGWSLLAAHGAAAAKLRQWLPKLEAALAEQGWPQRPIKVRIQPPQAPG
jgi:hypothetical protein